LSVPIIIVGIIVLYILNCIKVLREYERGVIFRLGRVLPQPKGPGLIFVFSPIDRIVRISLRLVTLDIPPQDVITKDNVSVKVNAVVYFRVMNPLKAVIDVQDYLYATSQLAQTTLRSVLGEVELDDLLSKREKLNSTLQEILESKSSSWKQNMWTCPNRWSGPSPSRRKQNGSVGPKSSMRKENSRPPAS
jgi:regulator of protease activity HflC (stomatin/prohibitin superfamily)